MKTSKIHKISEIVLGKKKGKQGRFIDTPEKREARIKLYAERAAANLDIFTGKFRVCNSMAE